MQHSIPVIVDYDGVKRLVEMGPFERSLERDFSLALNEKAIKECRDMDKLKEVSINMMKGWSNMQDAVSNLVKENLQLRQAMALRESELKVAEQLIEEAAQMIETQQKQQSSQSKPRLWPWQ